MGSFSSFSSFSSSSSSSFLCSGQRKKKCKKNCETTFIAFLQKRGGGKRPIWGRGADWISRGDWKKQLSGRHLLSREKKLLKKKHNVVLSDRCFAYLLSRPFIGREEWGRGGGTGRQFGCCAGVLNLVAWWVEQQRGSRG